MFGRPGGSKRLEILRTCLIEVLLHSQMCLMLLFFMSDQPVDGHGGEVEDGGGDGEDGEEVVDGAVCRAKVPAVVAHVDVVEGGVEGRHAEVRQRHVGDERVRDRPHVTVCCGIKINCQFMPSTP